MFTGIIERPCPVLAIQPAPAGAARSLLVDLAGLTVEPPAEGVAALGDSVAINGVCLTVAELRGSAARFDAIDETLARTNLGDLTAGARVNVERALRFGDRLDGHIVQGHVEATGRVRAVEQQAGQLWLEVDCGPEFAARTLPKGSVTLDGVSLTVAELGEDHFAVALIPHTLELTTLGDRAVGDRVNLEADVIGQWVQRLVAPEREG